MKKLVFLFLILSIPKISAQQNGIAYYSKKVITEPIINNASTSNNEIREQMKLINKSANELSFRLEFNSNKSRFLGDKQISKPNDGLNLKMAEIVTNYNDIIFYDKSLKEITKKTEFAGQKFLVITNTKMNDWHLSKETIKINKYTCYKAIKKEIIEGRWGSKTIDIVAWYTPEIPVNYGPDGYLGLPGLILQLERNNIITYLTKISFGSNLEIEKPKKGKKVTKEEFDKIVKEIVSNRKANYSDN